MGAGGGGGTERLPLERRGGRVAERRGAGGLGGEGADEEDEEEGCGTAEEEETPMFTE